MRYLITTNASRRYQAGGMSFNFELTQNISSTWRGVLAVEDSAASTLLSAGYPQIAECTLEEYEAEKKTARPNGSSRYSTSSPQLPSIPPPGPVAVVESNTTAAPKPVEISTQLNPVEIQTKTIELVDELDLKTERKPRAA